MKYLQFFSTTVLALFLLTACKGLFVTSEVSEADPVESMLTEGAEVKNDVIFNTKVDSKPEVLDVNFRSLEDGANLDLDPQDEIKTSEDGEVQVETVFSNPEPTDSEPPEDGIVEFVDELGGELPEKVRDDSDADSF